MAGDQVKLLSAWASPFCMRALFALELTGVPYEVIEQDLRNKTQLLLDSNPVHKKLPVLLHNGKPICESANIVQYIDEVWNVGLMPKDPYARAQARFWGDFVDSKLNPAAVPLLRSAKAATEASKAYGECCSMIEEQLLSKLDETKPFVGGDSPNYVDVMLLHNACWLPTLAHFGLELPNLEDKCPRFFKIIEALRQHPAAKASMPHVEKLRAAYDQFFADRLNH